MFLAFAMAHAAFSQAVELRFTGVKDDGSHIRLDSVQISNTGIGARHWTQSAVAPDTILSFGSSGIAVAEAFDNGISCYPNPAQGRASVVVSSQESCHATLVLCDVSGRKVFEMDHNLVQGDNVFEVSMAKPSLYLFSVLNGSDVRTVKVLNHGNSGRYGITSKAVVPANEKRQSTRYFVPGDSLIYVGFSTCNGKVLISRTVRQRQNNSETIRLVFVPPIQGMLRGLFSISRTEQVRFSQGNLQWSGSGTHSVAGNTTVNGTWRFAPNQYDTIGADNKNMSSTYTGWVDLFGWGASGYNSTNGLPNCTTYGSNVNTLTGSNYDWGVYNAISNGGNQPGLWRTLTKDEWNYLLAQRDSASVRCGLGQINGVRGLILLPDLWSLPTGLTFNPDASSASSAGLNTYTSAQWNQMQDAGAVFLPCGGEKQSGDVYSVNWYGKYWTASSPSTDRNGYDVFFYPSGTPSIDDEARFNCLSVRLVKTY